MKEIFFLITTLIFLIPSSLKAQQTDDMIEIVNKDVVYTDRVESEIKKRDIIITSAFGLTAGLGKFFIPNTNQTWRQEILFDEKVRELMRAQTEKGRQNADTASDVILYAVIAQPWLEGGSLVFNTGSHAGDTEMALKVSLINLESFAVTSTIIVLTKHLVGRERPYADGCIENPQTPGCETADRNQSMISGHTAMAFTSAGLVCAHHEAIDFYGGGFADKNACLASMVAASAVGVLRIVADKHWSTDVLAGAAVGLFSGYILPKLLHYSKSEFKIKALSKKTPVTFIPVLGPTGGGLILRF